MTRARIAGIGRVRFGWLTVVACMTCVCCASAEVAWPPKAASSQPGGLFVGELPLPTGVYEVTFRLRIDRREDTVTPLAALSVNLPGCQDVVYKEITPINFDSANTTQEFKFLFDNFKTQGVQVLVSPTQYKFPVPSLTVEKISIAPVLAPCIGPVWPGKILYRTREDAKGLVVVFNGASQPQTVTLRCALESDLSTVRKLDETVLTLAPGERREVPVKWNTGKEEYGFALTATLLDANGKELGQNKEYFSVADNLWKVGITGGDPRRAIPSGYGPNESIPVSEAKKFEDLLAAELAKPFAPVRWNYMNWTELGWSPDDFFNMAPEIDYWYAGTWNYTVGKRWLHLTIEWVHRRGMRAISYLNPFSIGYGGETVYKRHPEWFVYDKNGQLNVGTYYQKKLEVGSVAGGTETPWKLSLAPYALTLAPNIAMLEPIDAQVEQIVKSQQMFGWDGIRFDNYVYTATGYDFYGKKIDGNDPKRKDALEVRAWSHMRDSVWKKLGADFVIGDNDDYELRARYPAAWDESCRKGQLLMEELPRVSWQPTAPHNRWIDYMQYYHRVGDIVRDLGGHHLIIGIDNHYPVDQMYLHIITYAIRAHPYGAYHFTDLPLGNYMQFVTRYSALMWDIERIKPLTEPDKKIAVNSSGPVWWKELACVRQLSKGNRQYIVHLINPPVQERIYIDPTNAVPPVLKNIQVNLKPDKGETISRAWLLSADPMTHAEALTVAAKDGQVSVTVPKLYFWSVVVFE